MLTIVDDLVSVDTLIEERLTEEPINEYVQSCDIVAFNKICKSTFFSFQSIIAVSNKLLCYLFVDLWIPFFLIVGLKLVGAWLDLARGSLELVVITSIMLDISILLFHIPIFFSEYVQVSILWFLYS